MATMMSLQPALTHFVDDSSTTVPCCRDNGGRTPWQCRHVTTVEAEEGDHTRVPSPLQKQVDVEEVHVR